MKTIFITILMLFSGYCFSQTPHTVIVTKKGKKTELTKVDEIGPFYFKNGFTAYKNERYVESTVNALKIYGIEKIELVGHCSTEALTKTKNIAIKRVEFIKSLFIKFGIPASKIKTIIENDKVPLDLKNSKSRLNMGVKLWIM